MPKIYKILFLVVVIVTAKTNATSQVVNDSVPVSVNVPLENIFNAKSPKQYVISDIKVTGTTFDPNLIISISGLAVGDKVTIPGGDNFSKAISNLWKQNLVSDVQIYFTDLVDDKLSVEINITDRPSLTTFKFKGVSKSEADDLTPKLGLAKGKVTRVTENLKTTAINVIKKFYIDKGFRNVDVKVNETKDPNAANSVNIIFVVDKNAKVRIKDIYFAGNESASALKLKKQMKGTKEMSRITLFPTTLGNVYDSGRTNKITFTEYLRTNGYLIPSKTKDLVDPYIRFKLGSSKFNDKKYQEDKQSLLNYYNSIGFRDAVIADDTTYNDHGGLDVAVKLNEGNRYYFGNITWKGNTKYSDSILSLLLGIKKGDIYNAETLNKKLGTQPSAEGGDISSLYQDDGYLFFRITPVETAVYNDTIDHEIRIVEGPQATIGKVNITGNDKTKDYVIRRERSEAGDDHRRPNGGHERQHRHLHHAGWVRRHVHRYAGHRPRWTRATPPCRHRARHQARSDSGWPTRRT